MQYDYDLNLFIISTLSDLNCIELDYLQPVMYRETMCIGECQLWLIYKVLKAAAKLMKDSTVSSSLSLVVWMLLYDSILMEAILIMYRIMYKFYH